MLKALGPLFLSTHPLPSLAVTSFAVLYGASSGLSPIQLALVSLAVLTQQFSVGLSNDWIDYSRDKFVDRQDKPVALGRVSKTIVRNSAFISAAIALTLSVLLGEISAVIMIVMLSAGWSYNLGLKSGVFSVVPYIVGFGVLPSFVTFSTTNSYSPELWVFAAASLLGVSAHFANALPDLIDDRRTKVFSLPHVLGQRLSGLVIAASALAASATVILQSSELNRAIGLSGFIATLVLSSFAAILAFRTPIPRIIFPIIVLVSLVNVFLLVLG
jgi:4-hydroxybenzoate polyprenyltransferase